MGKPIHAFTSYLISGDEIIYINDEGYDITYSGWVFVKKMLSFCNYINKKTVELPCYDRDGVYTETDKLVLIDPPKLKTHIENAIEILNKIDVSKNLLIDNDTQEYLFFNDTEQDGTYNKQKERLLDYAKLLLKWSKRGLYIVEEWDV